VKKISFFSFSRSDYASLKPVIIDALEDKGLQVEVVAGGSHLLNRFGQTIKNFEKDNIPVHEITDFMQESDDSNEDMAKAAIKGYSLFVKYLLKSKPDYVFILGDRWELLPLSEAAFLLRIPIIHHSGGDITQGALDNQVRYAVSMKSHVHLVGMDEHRLRLLKMGEEAWRVVTVGEPALTHINKLAESVTDVHSQLGLENMQKFVLATFHPTTFESISVTQQADVFLAALKNINLPVILTAPNPDPGSKYFLEELERFVAGNSRVRIFQSLGDKLYYAAMMNAEFMIGNSSSGIWEAPSFKLPVLNIGKRQDGRTRAINVVDVPLHLDKILEGIKKVSAPEFKSQLKDVTNPYGFAGTSELILKTIKQLPERNILLEKKFVDPLGMALNG
jgi:UDP-hydrolysing UDP-N-acetyl-D-glucosamine 2-epimerase